MDTFTQATARLVTRRYTRASESSTTVACAPLWPSPHESCFLRLPFAHVLIAHGQLAQKRDLRLFFALFGLLV